jgi:hypothetical protein
MCGNAQTTFSLFVKPEELIVGRPLTDVSLIVDTGIATSLRVFGRPFLTK